MVRSLTVLFSVCLVAGCLPWSTIHENRGDLCLAEGRFGEAVYEYTLLLQSECSINNLIQRARAWEGVGDLNEAIEDYDSALVLFPESIEALTGRGMARARELFRRCEPETLWLTREELSALRILTFADLNRAVALAPGDPHVYRSRAYARHLLGDHRGAMKDLGQAIRLGETDEWTEALSGSIRRALGE